MNKHHARNYRGLLAASLACVLTTPVWAAQAPGTDPVKEEVKAVLQKHDEAMDKQDVKALLALYADDPTIAMMGTGPGEFWKGKAEVETAYKEFLKDFKAGSLKHQCPDTSGGHQGDVAWLVASCNMQDTTPDGQKRDYVLNVSAVLKKEKDGWKFQTLHFSNLTGSDAPPPGSAAPAAPAAPPAAAPKKAE
ncbi:MAG: nuclear transport factor 2 family protein [Candidatus Contendobacter sp.]|nr:MAG: nuclear transport factor 2 family protein [Candidatus Contendobacter sp.]